MRLSTVLEAQRVIDLSFVNNCQGFCFNRQESVGLAKKTRSSTIEMERTPDACRQLSASAHTILTTALVKTMLTWSTNLPVVSLRYLIMLFFNLCKKLLQI